MRTPRVNPLRAIPSLHRATHQVALHIAASLDLGVTQAEAHILDHLATAGACTVGSLHRAFAHRRSTLTSVLDRLTDRKLVQRDPSATDRRTFVVSLTSAGRALASRIHTRLQQIEARALARVSARDLQGFGRVIESLEHTLGSGSKWTRTPGGGDRRRQSGRRSGSTYDARASSLNSRSRE